MKYRTLVSLSLLVLAATGICFKIALTRNSAMSQNSKPLVSKATLQYFNEVAFGPEFGEDNQRVVKWTKPNVNIAINGEPKPEAIACLADVINDFNSISTEVKLSTATATNDINVYLVPEPDFKDIARDYKPINQGYFSVLWNNNQEIYNAKVLIDSTNLSDQERCHLIREETTQAMGLMKDSHSYIDSVFYDDWTTPIVYASIDKEIIRMLYGKNGIRPGDDKEEVSKKFRIN